MRIAIDMMGGDFAPVESIAGVLSFLEKYRDCELLLLGDEAALKEGLGDPGDRPFRIVPTRDEISMHEHPVKAMKEKQESALVKGFGMLAKGMADAFVSAGNTEVMLVGAAHVIKLSEGVLRPTIPTPVPQVNGGYSVMLDVGINADCKPEHLNQFALLGSVYAKEILGLNDPSVALLNIGEEEGKGNLLAQATYPLLKANPGIRFIGNIEGRDVLDNKADIMVTDGFTGNLLLKFAESLYDVVLKKRGMQDEFLEKFNHKLYAGVPVLGCDKPLVVGHGVSDRVSFAGMFELARKMVQSDMCGKIRSALA